MVASNGLSKYSYSSYFYVYIIFTSVKLFLSYWLSLAIILIWQVRVPSKRENLNEKSEKKLSNNCANREILLTNSYT